ncbi:MAG: prolipoprotein diacylglyceryl transferase [Candidatus Omnitrophica bacterium]|nr:prolipoprotein diacylglyceryl transferase [Candidatus Omnitrophota bacterium]
MHPTLFKIGSFEIGSFGLMVAIGFFAAYWVGMKEATRKGIAEDRFANFIIITLLAGLLGAKLLHVWVYLGQDSIKNLFFSRSGLVFYGGLIAGIPTGYYLTRKYGWNPWMVADIAAVAIPIGHFFGRIGCFLNGCCFGRECGLPWAVRFPKIVNQEGYIVGSEPYSFQLSLSKLSGSEPYSLPVHPTQLYSALGALLTFAFLYFYLSKRSRFRGELALWYLLLYSTYRFIVEIFRADPRGGWHGLSTSQWISVGLFALAICLWGPLKKTQTIGNGQTEENT